MIGESLSNNIVINDTNELINKANDIILQCTGPNCNTSLETRQKIFTELSILSNEQAYDTIALLSLPNTSPISQLIVNKYGNLAEAVSSVYIYQCGSTINNRCVLDSDNVKIAQEALIILLYNPGINKTRELVTISLIIIIIFISFMLFFIFLLFGFIESLFSSNNYILINNDPQPNIKTQEVNIVKETKPSEILLATPAPPMK